MKIVEILYVRIDYKVEKTKVTKEILEEHIAYLKLISEERFFMGGGFINATGGMIIFQAKSMKEAKEISDNDPLIKKMLYTYELKEWEIVLLSEKIQNK